MEKDEFQKLLEDQNEEIKRHEKTLLEDFQSQLKIIAEVQIEQGKKLDALLEMVANKPKILNSLKAC